MESIPAALTIDPGDTIGFSCYEGADGQFTPDCYGGNGKEYRLEWIHSLAAPVAVESRVDHSGTIRPPGLGSSGGASRVRPPAFC